MTVGEARSLAILASAVPVTFGVAIFAMLAAPDGLDELTVILALIPWGAVYIWAMNFSLRMDWPKPFTQAVNHTQKRTYLAEARQLLPGWSWRWVQAIRWCGIVLSVVGFGLFAATVVAP